MIDELLTPIGVGAAPGANTGGATAVRLERRHGADRRDADRTRAVPRERVGVRGRRRPRSEDRPLPRPARQPRTGRVDVGRHARARRVRGDRRVRHLRRGGWCDTSDQRRPECADAGRRRAQLRSQRLAPQRAALRARRDGRRRVRSDGSPDPAPQALRHRRRRPAGVRPAQVERRSGTPRLRPADTTCGSTDPPRRALDAGVVLEPRHA